MLGGILAHDKRFALAAEEAALARRLDPSLVFTQPEKFNAFTRLLDREQAAGSRAASLGRSDAPQFAETAPLPSSGGVPGWVWGLGAGALALLAWRAFSTRRQTPAQWPPAMPGSPGTLAMASTGGPAGPAPGGFAAASAPATPLAGSGLLGTGLAVAGGVAAGMLAEKLFEGRRDTGLGSAFSSGGRGLEPSLYDDQHAGDAAARELEQRPIDIGIGDGWGGGDVGVGTSDDGDGW